jgi:type IX secretion system PorP/SprF family membrane protein
MMHKLIRRILLLGLMTYTLSSQAQDFHFSQYYNAPLLFNPANTGFMPDYDYRIGGNYRNQWANIGSPYKTMSVWGDAKLFNKSFENGWMGIGGMLLNDVAGGGSLNSYKGTVSVAYHQLVGDNSVLSGGLGFGFINKRIDINKLSFDNQWNGQFFDITASSNEPLAYSSVYYFDMQAGINFAFFPTDNVYVNMGVAGMHLNHPKETFYNTNTVNDQVPHRYTAFVNSSIKIQDLWIINPNLYVSKMGNAWETVLGLTANRNLSGDGESQLILGLYYRNSDALIPVVGYQLNDLKITFNYDATISSLGTYNGTQGAYEISIVKSGLLGGESFSRSVKCPALKF